MLNNQTIQQHYRCRCTLLLIFLLVCQATQCSTAYVFNKAGKSTQLRHPRYNNDKVLHLSNILGSCYKINERDFFALKSNAGESTDILTDDTTTASDTTIVASTQQIVPPTTATATSSEKKLWPCGDELDQRIIKLALPAMANFAILPLVGAADTFWVGRMKNALALAGQGAANQVFSSAFWIISFLPSIITPLVAKAAGSGDKDAMQDHIRDAGFLGLFMGILGMLMLIAIPKFVLASVLTQGSPAMQFAEPYLAIRGLTFLPALLSTICFAAFRGTMDIVTPLKIAVISNIVNVVLDPILIFKFKMGVSGAAAATCIAEIISFALYFQKMTEKKMLNLSKFTKAPSLKSVRPLLLGGLSVQMRAVALNIAFLAVTRRTQSLDTTGTLAAAHAITIQLWQLGGIVLLALSTVASIIVPTAVAKANRESPTIGQPVAGLHDARAAADRLLRWGVVMGGVLAGLQIACLPLLNVFSPLPEVQAAARLPSIIGALLQLINGVVFIGEGIQQGNQYFGSLAAVTGIATIGMLTSLRLYGQTLAGVWGSFAVFNLIRLMGVIRHHFFDGPLSAGKINRPRVK